MRQSSLLPSAIIFLILFAATGQAAEKQVGGEAICGNYSYVLPEGFKELKLTVDFDENLPLGARLQNSAEHIPASVTCILVNNPAEESFIGDKITSYITGSELQKTPTRVYPKKYVTELPKSIRLYTSERFSGSDSAVNFIEYVIELKAVASEKNVLLFVQGATFLPVAKDDPRTDAELESANNAFMKTRAMQLIRSIRRIE